MNAIELVRAKNAAIANQAKVDAAKQNQATEVAKTVDKPDGRLFYARQAHSKFIFSDNVEVIFAFGRLEVTPKTFPGIFNRPTGHGQEPHPYNGRPRWWVYMQELNAIVPPQGNNPMIYTQDTWNETETLPAVTELGGINAVNEQELAIAESALSRAGNLHIEQQSGIATIGAAPSSADSSTLDKELLQQAQRGNTSPLGNTAIITKVNPEDLNLNAQSSTS